MNKNTGLWYLYDFANSFASVVLVFYFPLIFVEKGGMSLWVGIATSISTILLLIFLPRVGRFSDRTGKRKQVIAFGTFIMSLSLVLLSVLFSSDVANNVFILWSVIILYIIFQFSFQASVSVYSSLLKYISTDKSNVKVSGIGISFGQFGNALALGLVAPIIAGSAMFWGISGKPLAFLFGGIVSFILAIPFLIWGDGGEARKTIGSEFSYGTFVKKVFKDKQLTMFLIGMMLLADAILTFQIYVTLYVSKVFGFSDKMVSYAGIAGLLAIVITGFFVSRLTKIIGSKMKVLHIGSLLYSLCFLLIAIVPPISWVIFLMLILCGVSYAFVFSLGRAIYSEVTPHDEQAEFFSAYSVFERAASIIGPVVWAFSFLILSRFGENIQFRGSILVLMIISIIGYLFLKQIRDGKFYGSLE